MDKPWAIDELAHAGPEHLDPAFVAGYDRKQAFDPIEDLEALRAHGQGATKKYRDVRRSGRAALVINDVLPPWQPRGVEVRGRAEALDEPGAPIRLYPERIVSWGIESDVLGERHARVVR